MIQNSNNYPKISVFVLVYNQEDFIRETLDSVLIQNYPNLEIVIGDDCSTDSTVSILKEYDLNYPNLFKLILSDKNEGITANCNKILNECTGEYIALLGGDDLWLPNKLIKQIDWFRQNPNAVLCYTLTNIFNNTTKDIISTQPNISPEKLQKEDVFSIIYNLGACESSFLVKKCAIPESQFNTQIPTVSDWLFFVEVIYKKEFGGLQEELTFYRRHLNNTSNNLNLIYKEHYQSLVIAKGIFPEIIDIINKWEIITLRNLYLINEDDIRHAITYNNAKDVWISAANLLNIKTFLVLNLKYTRKRFKKSVYKFFHAS